MDDCQLSNTTNFILKKTHTRTHKLWTGKSQMQKALQNTPPKNANYFNLKKRVR